MSTDLRHELHTLIDKIVDAIEGAASAEYFDQKTSPLGRERHCRLVREGHLKGIKEGKRVMVLRKDVEAYLARRTVIRVNEKAGEDREVQRIIASMEKRRSA